jgi:ribonuclease D
MQKSISKEEVNELPLFQFEGKIHLVSSEEKAKALKSCFETDENIYGVDTETKPVFKKGFIILYLFSK